MNLEIPKSSIALGFFDGVHSGHKKVINSAIEYSDNPVVFTFLLDDDKSKNKRNGKLIFPDNIRLQLLEQTGAKVFALPFSKIADFSPSQFVEEILVKKLNADAVFCGDSFRFGKNASADVNDLKILCKQKKIESHIIPSLKINNKIISSTLIRNFLLRGDLKKAKTFLGHNYFLENEIIIGNGIGNRLGVPTINLSFLKNQLIPKHGVYASFVYIDKQKYLGATNIGTKPSFGANTPICETHIIGYESKSYGKIARVELVRYIREEKAFNSHKELSIQIQKDIEFIKNS